MDTVIRYESNTLMSSVFPCRYEWKKDGVKLDINGIDFKRTPGEGTLVIDSPKESHEGTYQCLAKNELGTALSVKSTLKLAGQYFEYSTLHC